jgi:hypothetical protein
MPAELDHETDEGVPELLVFRSSRAIDLWGRCGHENDHVGKPCRHAAPNGPCQCASGVRTDALLNAQMAEMVKTQKETLYLLRDLFMLTMEVNGYAIDSEGNLAKKSGIVIPK